MLTKDVYLTFDNCAGSTKDWQIINKIKAILEEGGFNVKRTRRGPNEMAQNYNYLYNNNIKNSIILNIMNGVDPSNIREASQDKINGYWYANKATQPMNNVVVLGWLWEACDCVHPGGSCYNSVRASETSGRLYNPKQFMDEHGILYFCSSPDYTGEKAGKEFLAIFQDVDFENSMSNNIKKKDPSTTTTTTTSDTTDAETTTQQQVYWHKLYRVTTDENGVFEVKDIQLPYKTNYTASYNYGGSIEYSSTNKNTEIIYNAGAPLPTVSTTTTGDGILTSATPIAGVPDVSKLGSNYVLADENATFTLKPDDYKATWVWDRKTLQLLGKLSRYVTFTCQNDTTKKYVIRREKWNWIQKQIYTKYLDFKYSKNITDPTVTVNLSGNQTNYGIRVDDQNTGYTCGPTSLSMCSQLLMNYHAEPILATACGTTGDGTGDAQIQSGAAKYNMKITGTKSVDAVSNALRNNKPVIQHRYGHYFLLYDVDDAGTQWLVGNSSSDPRQGWHNISELRNRVYGWYWMICELNFNFSDADKTNAQIYLSNMGGEWRRTENKNDYDKHYY